MSLIFKIAAGILLAGIVSFGVRVAYINYAAHVAQQALQAQLQKQQERRVQLQKQREEQERIKRKNELLAAERSKARAEASALKSKAWYDYYIPPKGCEVFKSDKHMVECVSHKKRARQEFERLYSQGLLART